MRKNSKITFVANKILNEKMFFYYAQILAVLTAEKHKLANDSKLTFERSSDFGA